MFSALKMDDLGFFETLFLLYETAGRNIHFLWVFYNAVNISNLRIVE
jgi:hypothetical protein